MNSDPAGTNASTFCDMFLLSLFPYAPTHDAPTHEQLAALSTPSGSLPRTSMHEAVHAMEMAYDRVICDSKGQHYNL